LLCQAANAGLRVLPGFFSLPESAVFLQSAEKPGLGRCFLRRLDSPLADFGLSETRSLDSIQLDLLETGFWLIQPLSTAFQARGSLALDPEFNQDQVEILWPEVRAAEIIEQIKAWDSEEEVTLNQRLAKLSALFRMHICDQKVTLEWADDGSQTWLVSVQTEPLLEPPTAWKPLAELEAFGQRPEPLLCSLLNQLAEDISESWLKPMGLEPRSVLLKTFAGELFFQVEFITQLTAWRDNLSWWSYLRTLRQAIKQSQRARRWLLESFSIPHPGLLGYTQQLAELYALYLGVSLPLSLLLERALLPFEKAGVLESLQRLSFSSGSRLLQALNHLRDLAQILLAEGRKPDLNGFLRHAVFRQEWQVFMSQYGHRGSQEFLPSSLRLADQPERVLKALLLPWQAFREELEPPRHYWFWRPLWKILQPVLEEREDLRSDALWAIYQVRKQMQNLIETAVQAEQLPTEDDFWQLNLEEVAALDRGAIFSSAYLAPRQQSEGFCANTHQPESQNKTAKALFPGEREVMLWCPLSAEENLPEDFKPWSTCLVLAVFDPGRWLQIQQVSMVILAENSDHTGALSFLREAGIPALTGVGEDILKFKTGQEILIRETEWEWLVLEEEPESEASLT